MLKIFGRNNSINVQKVMWAIGELGLPHERIDVGGAFGRNKEPDYLAMNPNGLVPTLQEDDGFILWESNTIVRYLAAKHGAGTLEPKNLQEQALASQWMDWQYTVAAPAIFDLFWGLVRTPPEQRNAQAIETAKRKTIDAMYILNKQLGKTAFMAGDNFSMGDIPVGLFAYRYRKLVPDGPSLSHAARWAAAIEGRPAFQQHVLSVPLT